MKYLNIAKLREANEKESKVVEKLLELGYKGNDITLQLQIQMATVRMLDILESCFEEK